MSTRSKLLLAALTAAAAISTLVADASARSFSASEREFELLFRSMTAEASGSSVSCPITLLGHFFERTMAKVASQVAVIKHVEPTQGAEPSPCTGGSITILTETLPWRVNYVGFTGRLPTITAIRWSLIGAAVNIRTDLVCLVGTTSLKPAFGESIIGGTGRVEGVRSDETVGIPLGGSFLCSLAGDNHFIGTGTALNLPRTASITVTLI